MGLTLGVAFGQCCGVALLWLAVATLVGCRLGVNSREQCNVQEVCWRGLLLAWTSSALIEQQHHVTMFATILCG